MDGDPKNKSRGGSMCNTDLSKNPFVGLFQSTQHAQQYLAATQEALSSSSQVPIPQNKSDRSSNKEGIRLIGSLVVAPDSTRSGAELHEKDQIVSDMLQRIFLLNVNPDPDYHGVLRCGGVPPRSIFVRDLAKDLKHGRKYLSMDNLHQALMERLMMSQPRINLSLANGARDTSVTRELEAIEPLSIKYLAQCYARCMEEQSQMSRRVQHKAIQDMLFDVISQSQSMILSYCGTVLLSPEAFPTSLPDCQLFNFLFKAQDPRLCSEFLVGLVKAHSDPADLEAIFSPILDRLFQKEKLLSLMQPDVFSVLDIILFFAKSPQLAKVLVHHPKWLPESQGGQLTGVAFQKDTLLGPLLALSSVSTEQDKPSEYFTEPSRQGQGDIDAITGNIRRQLNVICEKLAEIFHSLLQNANIQHNVLYWLGLCLHTNAKRAQLFARYASAHSQLQASDGFFMNLAYVLLRLAIPLSKPKSKVLLKVDARYAACHCKPPTDVRDKCQVYLWNMNDETPLVPPPDGEKKIHCNDVVFKFVSHCFFLTHKCIKIGLVKIFDGYHSLMKELQQLSDVYREARTMSANDRAIEPMRSAFEEGIQRQLSLKAHLLNPDFMDLAMNFCSGSCYWLIQQCLAEDCPADMNHRTIILPLSNQTPVALTMLPEMIPENVADCLIWLGHFSEETLEKAAESLEAVMDYFSMFLGSTSRIHNPHLRAKHAEALAAFLPRPKANDSNLFSFSYRKGSFEKSIVSSKLLPEALLQLFVDIEFTGHSMEFEQKFGYRHHMYAILEYVWSLPAYHKTFFALYEEARVFLVEHSQFSVFPRFLNLLVNDSTFLLDEAMDYLCKIRELQTEKDKGCWNSLTVQERQEKEKTLKQHTSFARGYNIMANETVHALCFITKDITKPFASPCMADRMAAFLNYFLVHLVGPKRRDLKVQDFDKLHFKPKELVSNIVQILLNLCQEEDFCRAVVSDGRSYSEGLYESAEKVLIQINKPYAMIEGLRQVALKCKKCASELKEQDDGAVEAPEEFLDPILGTIMFDPVLLPSSGMIVDKATIARHIISDPKDPFNRSPLSLNMVERQDELRERIEAWMKEHNIRKPQYSMADCSG